MNSLKQSTAFSLATSSLVNILAKNPLHVGFKIGKTVQTLEQRFAENYADDYDCIKALYDAGPDGALIDWLEEEVIKYCQSHFPDECDNEQIGGGPKCADHTGTTHSAKLYAVIR